MKTTHYLPSNKSVILAKAEYNEGKIMLSPPHGIKTEIEVDLKST